MSKEFTSMEEWMKYYFPNGMPEVPQIPQLADDTSPRAITLLDRAAKELQNHANEYGHPGQHDLIKDIKNYVDGVPPNQQNMQFQDLAEKYAGHGSTHGNWRFDNIGLSLFVGAILQRALYPAKS
jgi:hypothetical protein